MRNDDESPGARRRFSPRAVGRSLGAGLPLASVGSMPAVLGPRPASAVTRENSLLESGREGGRQGLALARGGLVAGRADGTLARVNSIICDAIRSRRVLEFDYHGLHRVVVPYCHGVSARGTEVLRAIQIAGPSASGGFGFGKLWIVDEMSRLRLTETPFSPDDPNYNPDDSAMVRIHCRVAIPT
ncbi:MAG TPA: hypothetical protein VF989_04025 [Polyangiaceae bacterium]|jgi:hypothetical protein